MSGVRVRFAPSPTGELHVGNLRTAIFNWLFARRHGGVFILRIEDTDQTRSSAAMEQAICRDLRWLGLEWDEGPETGGAAAPYRQSERKALYREYAQKLLAAEKIYPCYCTAEELEAKKQSFLRRRMQPRYDGQCRNLSAAERERLAADGRRPALRFRVDDGTVRFTDLVRGEVEFDCRQLGDFIVSRSDGMANYNFCAAVDDGLMRISHVIRAEDHLSNTPRQILVQRALGLPGPAFAHLSLIVDAHKNKLKKRESSPSVRSLQEEGYLPEALLNFMSLLGWSPEDAQEVMTRGELISRFSLERCAKSSAMYDSAKLRWLNGQHLRRLDAARLAERCLPFLGAQAEGEPAAWSEERLRAVFACLRDNMEILADARELLPLFMSAAPPLRDDAREFLRAGAEVARAFREEIAAAPEISEAAFGKIMAALKTRQRISGKTLFMPIRAAMTGRANGPELAKIFALLTRETLLARIDAMLAAAA